MNEVFHVLMVEDDEEDVLIIQELLAPHPSFRLRNASTLAAALETVAAGGIDAVLLDLTLPDSQGESTFDAIHTVSPLLPIVVLTGLDDQHAALAAVQRGAQDYLVKGQVQTETLTRAIRYAMERHRLIRELEAKNADLEETSHRLATIINGNTEGMLIVSRMGRIEFCNRAAEQMFACPSTELVGALFGIPSTGNAPLELGIVRCPDDHRDAEMRVVSTLWRHEHAHLILLRDITWQKKTDQALRLYRDHLKELVERRTEQLSEINTELNREIQQHHQTENALRESLRQLEAHSRAQLDFVSNVSHELRTPLTSIGYALNNLLSGVAGQTPAPIRSYLLMINEDIERLNGTISDILDMSRIEAKTLALRQIKLHLSRLILHAISSIQDMAGAKRQRITFFAKHDHSFVSVDPKRIERVIMNLVGNAIKFTPEGGLIEIRIFSKPSAPESVFMTLADTGIGIGPEHIEHVTERYYRVGEQVDGTGLGLALCKEITELHGGVLRVQSPPDEHPRGTQINIALPTCAPPTVLVVDDEPLVRTLVARQLEAEGYAVVTCASAPAAIDMLETRRIDSMVVDVLLPDMDGIQLISRIKTRHSSEALPVVVVTGTLLDEVKRDMLDGFSIPILTKPWKAEELMAAIEDTAAGRHFQREPAHAM